MYYMILNHNPRQLSNFTYQLQSLIYFIKFWIMYCSVLCDYKNYWICSWWWKMDGEIVFLSIVLSAYLVCKCWICNCSPSVCPESSSLALCNRRTWLHAASSSSSADASSRLSSSTRLLKRFTSASYCSARRTAWPSSVFVSASIFFSLLFVCLISDISYKINSI